MQKDAVEQLRQEAPNAGCHRWYNAGRPGSLSLTPERSEWAQQESNL
jgi:hypothetical protein